MALAGGIKVCRQQPLCSCSVGGGESQRSSLALFRVRLGGRHLVRACLALVRLVRGGAGPRAQRPTPLPAAPTSSGLLSPRRSVGHGLPFASPMCAEASGVAAYPALTFPTCAACLAGVRRPI